VSFNLGDVVPLSVTITDADGQPANAGGVTVTVTLPDGTTATPSITNADTGVYNADYPTVQAGRHGIRWVATGSNASAFTDAFTVDAADGGAFISLAEVKRHLNKTKTTDDDELLEFIAAACTAIEERIGHVTPTTVTEEAAIRWGANTIILDQRPVVDVTSVVLAGNPPTTIDPADADNSVPGWRLNAGAGVLTHSHSFPHGTVRVVYTAGRTPVPGNVRLAAVELAAFLWRSIKMYNSGGRPGAPGADDVMSFRGVAYALPNRVKELLGLGNNQPTDNLLVG
jgi:hypothetical protein